MLEGVTNNLSADEITEITVGAHGFVGSDLAALCSRAALHTTQRTSEVVEFQDLNFALTRIGPSAMRDFQIEVCFRKIYTFCVFVIEYCRCLM